MYFFEKLTSPIVTKSYCTIKVFDGTSITALLKVYALALDIGRSIIRIKLYYFSKVFDGFIKIIYVRIIMSTSVIRFNSIALL